MQVSGVRFCWVRAKDDVRIECGMLWRGGGRGFHFSHTYNFTEADL